MFVRAFQPFFPPLGVLHSYFCILSRLPEASSRGEAAGQARSETTLPLRVFPTLTPYRVSSRPFSSIAGFLSRVALAETIVSGHFSVVASELQGLFQPGATCFKSSPAASTVPPFPSFTAHLPNSSFFMTLVVSKGNLLAPPFFDRVLCRCNIPTGTFLPRPLSDLGARVPSTPQSVKGLRAPSPREAFEFSPPECGPRYLGRIPLLLSFSPFRSLVRHDIFWSPQIRPDQNKTPTKWGDF